VLASGSESSNLRGKQTSFSQGEAAESIFYLQSGRAKLTVVAKNGKKPQSLSSPLGESLWME
jgi:CRP-like cAMP-binding protein